MGDEAVEFSARFGGQPHHLYIPCRAVVAIFAKETGEGTGFQVQPIDPEEVEAQMKAKSEDNTGRQAQAQSAALKRG